MFQLTLDGLVAGLGGAFVTALIGYFGVVRKSRADETTIALEAWKSLLAPLQEELREAKEEIQELRKELEERNRLSEEREKRHKTEIEDLLSRIKEQEER